MKNFQAKIVEIIDNHIILNKTTFYPRGGGQLGDIGILKQEDKEFTVLDTIKKEGKTLHVLDDNSLNKEIEVYGEINWETRYMNMRHHSAIHVLCGVMYRDFKALVTGGQINLDKARVDFDVEGINSENKGEIEEGVNKIIQKDIKITAKNISREEALNIPDLVRTKPGMELVNRLKIIRIIEIENFDVQADGGTHVNSTKEIGKIEISKIENKGKHNKRIEVKLH
tara:strand:+ start:544 stop:1221 length:678 start_codon:yes stop_codon:yes gene_type:complete